MAKNKDDFYQEDPTSKSRKDSGIKLAQVGAAIGSRFGPYGIIVGSVAGFFIGVVVDEVLED